MKSNAVFEIFTRLQKQNPHPKCELVYASHFELLISVMLSAQSTDVRVNQATKNLYAVANTPEKIVELGEEKLKNYIKIIGLYNTKARNVMLTCQQLIEKHRSSVPCTREALEALPGVGRKTASVVLNTAFNKPIIAVDTHVFRVARRVGLAHGRTPRQVEEQLMTLVPQEFLPNANQWLVLHGRYTCLARKPKCVSCVLSPFCEFLLLG